MAEPNSQLSHSSPRGFQPGLLQGGVTLLPTGGWDAGWHWVYGMPPASADGGKKTEIVGAGRHLQRMRGSRTATVRNRHKTPWKIPPSPLGALETTEAE